MAKPAPAPAPLDDLVGRLIAMDDPGGPVLTASIDVRPQGDGSLPVLQALRQAVREALARQGDLPGDARQAVAGDAAALEDAITSAAGDGAQGLLFVSAAAANLRIELATPWPFRNAVHVGPRPWLFEMIRDRYLFGRPLCLVDADLHTMTARRIRHGMVDGTAAVDWAPHPLEKHKQRTTAEGFGGRGGAGGHAKNRVEQIVEARRARFAATASDELERFLAPDDLVVIAGVEEACAQILNHLPPLRRETAVEMAARDPGQDERDLLATLTALTADAQQGRADAAAVRWLAGAYGDRALGGIAAVRRGAAEGRLEIVLVHDDAADHFGTAADVRYHAAARSAAVEEVLRQALRQGADVWITREPRVLEQQEGVIGIARYA